MDRPEAVLGPQGPVAGDGTHLDASRVIVWHYIGDGRALLDVPARDIYADEILSRAAVDAIQASGLYQAAGAAPVEAAAHGSIDLADGVSDGEAHLAGKALRSRKKG